MTPPSPFVLGVATRAALRARLPLLLARARAARELGKPFQVFLRESGQDWVQAPVRLVLAAGTYQDLEEGLEISLARLNGDGPFPEDPRVRLEGREAGEPASPAIPPPARSVTETVLEVASSLTGYPRRDLDPERELRAQLGLDSLKVAQVIETLWDLYGVVREPTLAVADFPTLGAMIAFLAGRQPAQAGPSSPAPGPEGPARTPAAGRAPLAATAAAPPIPEEARELAARLLGQDLASIRLRPAGPGGLLATCARQPLTARRLAWWTEEGQLRMRAEGEPFLDPGPVLEWWQQRLGAVETSLGHVTGALMARFLSGVVVEEPGSAPGPRIYLSNHQTALESYLFPLLAAALDGLPVEGVAMLDHGVGWADPMRDFMFSHGALPPEVVAPLRGAESTDPFGLVRLVPELEADLSSGRWALHLAVEGARERTARHRLRTVSSVWIDLALRLCLPIVPVRFRGGLPLEDPGQAQDLPVGFGSQEILFGPLLAPEELAGLDPRGRAVRVLEALNGLGDPESEEPNPADPAFGRSVAEWIEYTGAPAIAAVVFRCLERHRPPGLPLEPGRHVLGHPTDALVAAGALGQALRRPVALVLPDTADGRWIATLAGMAFAERGPRVFLGSRAPEGYAATVEVG